jgi:2-polyprenyl-3-methyl-5-hydroxy-6-metoxy-1,4-benzoquinol methylase
MDAEAYISQHWLPNDVARNLKSERHQQRFDWIADRLPKGRWLQYADVGCACGHSTVELEKRAIGDWHGIDFSQTAIDEAQRLFPQNFFHYHPSPEQMTEMGHFAGVVCSEVLEHVPDPKAMIRALIEITGDTLVLTTPGRPVQDPGHLRTYTAETLRAEFPDEGLLKIEALGIFLFATWQRLS